MKRYLSLLLASVLPLALFPWFMPTPANQLDFLLLWFIAMILLALPMVYAEIALAYRSGLPPLAGIQNLTREADASTIWRGFSWLGALLAVVVSAMLVSGSAPAISELLTGVGIEIPGFALAIGLMVVAVIASFWGMWTAVVGLLLIVAGIALGLTKGATGLDFQMTAISLGEWGRAMMMALVSVGAGSGLYWFATHGLLQQESGSESSPAKKITNKVATKAVLPIWLVQVLAGGIAIVLSALSANTEPSLPATASLAIGSLLLSASLLSFAVQSLSSRLGLIKSMVLVLLLASALVMVVPSVLAVVLILLTSLATLLLTLFVGWQMKISHLRKSMNFSSELTYNLWRVAVRLVVPIAVLAGLAGWVMVWING